MSAFDEARIVERRGWLDVEPWVRSVTGGQYKSLFHDPAAQSEGYDLLAHLKGVVEERVELKCERKDEWGNFFLETWSNKKKGRVRDGWMISCHADTLLYYFIDPGDLYVIKFDPLWTWFFGDTDTRAAWFDYDEKPQKRFDQPNKTFGHPVPFGDVSNAVGFWKGRRQADGTFRGALDSRKAGAK